MAADGVCVNRSKEGTGEILVTVLAADMDTITKHCATILAMWPTVNWMGV